jgi:predicted ATPase/class 3 adenylate cyclase
MTHPGVGGWYPRSFVLTDIVGSVSLWERDADQMAQAVARHDAIIGREVVACDGELVRSKGEGDSTFSVFAHPAEAVAAAVAMQASVRAEQWPTTAHVRVRVGIHTGDAEPRDGDWYGPAVNRAARLRALADGNQTLLTGVTAALVGDRLPAASQLLYRGRRMLRGIDRPEEVWELVGADDPRLPGAGSARIGSLPPALTRFVGRSDDLERLVELLERERLVTLTGAGGSGKTRLALEVARDVTSGGEVAWLAELAPLRDGALVAQTVATAVGADGGSEPLDRLLAGAERLDGVLVLDNCEHLLDACTALTHRLLGAAPRLRVLATSREALGLDGERLWPVGPLDVPDEAWQNPEELARVESVQLLMDRAQSVRPDLVFCGDDVASVVQICRALEGMPLAIELVAGRLRSLSFADLAARLEDQLTVLARHRPTGSDDARHRSLRLTLDWSYDLLAGEQQALARGLSVFAGGFRLDAVEAVCGGALDVLDGIDELVAKSLVTFDPTSARYRLLEPLRQYLAERLVEAGAAESVQQAHAEWVAGLCDRLGTRLLEDQKARSLRLREESGNIELALRWAQAHDHAMAMRIVGSLGQYWFYYDQASARRWSDLVVRFAADVAPRTRAKALLSAGTIAQNDQAWNQSADWLREALAIYRLEGATSGPAAALYWLGRALVHLSDPPSEKYAMEATRCWEEGLQLFTSLGDVAGASWCRLWLSSYAFSNDDLGRSEQLANQVIDECDAAGVQHPIGQAWSILAFIARRRGSDATALAFLQDAVALYQELDNPWQLAGVLVELAEQEATMGRGAEALRALAESSRLDEQIGRLPGRSRRLAVAAVVHLSRRQLAMATAALGAYDAHPPEDAGRPWSRIGGSIGWLADLVGTTRAQLDPAKVAAARAAAQRNSLDELIRELIIRPAVEPCDVVHHEIADPSWSVDVLADFDH